MLLALIPVLSFADTITIDCAYPNNADPQGVHKTKGEFNLKFLVDKKTGKSYILGNNGSADVISVGDSTQLTFIEITGAKTVMTTTLALSTGKSVHSRNSVSFNGTLIPSQYYGTCELGN